MANLTAEQRYQKFESNNPNILQNVPLSYIASYLGITQRHLSRIRKG
jgi:CRP/FNR family transcriptional regulator, anaerobic regulatory protein